MKKFLAVLFLLVFVCTPAMARSIPGAPNEVHDPYFEDPQGSWYIEGNNWSLYPNAPYLPGNYLDPGRAAGDSVFIRTIVDDYEGLWVPDYTNKEIDLTFFAHLDGGGYIDVIFDYFLDENIPRPENDPNIPPPPDGQIYAGRIYAGDPGPFQIRNDLLGPNENLPPGWDLYMFHDIWDFQPRWVSIEIYAGIAPASQNGGEALITGVDFEAQCVPEPGAMLLFGFSGFMFLYKKIKKRLS